jgi:hypothetical protein
VTATTGSVTSVRLTLRPGVKILGHVRFEGTTAPPASEQLRSFTVTAAPVGNVAPLPGGATRGRGPGQVQPDGSFETQALAPGRYLVITNPMAPWRLESAMFDGRDLTVDPLAVSGDDVAGVVVTLTDVVAGIAGSIREPNGDVSREAVVFVFPADFRRWIERGMTGNADVRAAAPNGTYSFQRLRPGDYLVAAVLDADVMDRNDPSFINRVAQVATRVSLAAGAPQTVDLVAVRVSR